MSGGEEPDRPPPGPLLARGRDADIYDIGNGRVVRRNRNGRSQAAEATLLPFLAARGYPVPEVFDVDGGDLVLERVDGPTMVDDLKRRPWRAEAHMRSLADLHRRLHAIEAPPDLRVRRPGGVVEHGDLHPLNVLLSERGPIVIDWANGASGDGDVDVALTWMLMVVGELGGSRVERAVLAAYRTLLARRFLAHVGRPAAVRGLPLAADDKLGDRNLRPSEREGILRLLEREGVGG